MNIMLQFHIRHINAQCNYNITCYSLAMINVMYISTRIILSLKYIICTMWTCLEWHCYMWKKKTLIRLKLPLYEHNIPSFQDVVMLRNCFNGIFVQVTKINNFQWQMNNDNITLLVVFRITSLMEILFY